MKKSNSIKKFKEQKVENLDQIKGGLPFRLKLQLGITGWLDGIRRNTDFKPQIEVGA